MCNCPKSAIPVASHFVNQRRGLWFFTLTIAGGSLTEILSHTNNFLKSTNVFLFAFQQLKRDSMLIHIVNSYWNMELILVNPLSANESNNWVLFYWKFKSYMTKMVYFFQLSFKVKHHWVSSFLSALCFSSPTLYINRAGQIVKRHQRWKSVVV